MKKLKGNKLSGGCTTGKVFYFTEKRLNPHRVTIDAADVEQEVERITDAMKRTSAAMLETAKTAGGEAEAIMEAHAEIACDEFLQESAAELVRVAKVGAEFAVWRVYEDSARELEESGDPFCAARANDLRDVCTHLIAALRGEHQSVSFPAGSIVAAEDISPSAAAVLEGCGVAGLICETASQTSHAAIMARAAGIPCVTGITGLSELFCGGEFVALDADEGTVIVDPDEDTLRIFDGKMKRQGEYFALARSIAAQKIFFKDGRRFDILLNISSPADCTPEVMAISDGIGLYRTEYLYMNSPAIPDFGRQLREYRDLLCRAGDKSVTVRTLDIGADKRCPSIHSDREENPALGLRGIRLCFDRTEVFLTQLKALLAASVSGRLRIMFPMISTASDVMRARELVGRAMNELAGEGIAFKDDIKIGAMLEVPSALIMADKIAELVDFASVGTNDLCQYTMAADRMNSRVSGYSDPFSPAVLRLIANAAAEFEVRGKKLSVCGEAASSPHSALLLCGLGVTSLSMSAPAVPYVKLALNGADHDHLSILGRKCLCMSDADDVRKFVERELKL